MTDEFIKTVALAGDRSSNPLILPWPMPGNLGGFISFSAFSQWQTFVLDLSLRHAVPDIIAAKFQRSQKLHLLTWIDFDLIKAGELAAMAALELALKDRYGAQVKRSGGAVHFHDLLVHMVQQDGLTDEKIPLNQRCGCGAVVGRLTGVLKPSLAAIRNDLAHGDPFDGFPQAGLLELVRDLIDYAYRDWA